MQFLHWDDSFYTGIMQADYEHRKMIDLINSLHAGWAREGASDSEKLIEDVFAVLMSHFALEERLMTDCCYDMLTAHKNDHGRIIEEVRDMLGRQGKSEDDTAGTIGECLQCWLAAHIQNHDVRMYKVLEATNKTGGHA